MPIDRLYITADKPTQRPNPALIAMWKISPIPARLASYTTFSRLCRLRSWPLPVDCKCRNVTDRSAESYNFGIAFLSADLLYKLLSAILSPIFIVEVPPKKVRLKYT